MAYIKASYSFQEKSTLDTIMTLTIRLQLTIEAVGIFTTGLQTLSAYIWTMDLISGMNLKVNLFF